MKIFRNAMFLEVLLEIAAGLMDWYILLDICIIALATTAGLWVAFLNENKKRRKAQ